MGSISDNSAEDPLNFRKIMTDSVLKFLSKLYDDDSMTKKSIQFFIDCHMKYLLNDVFRMIKNQIQIILEEMNVDWNDKTKVKMIMSLLMQYEHMFLCLETEHQREKMLEECGAFIPPVSFPIRTGSKIDKSTNMIIPVDTDGQFIPMRDVLKGYLEMPGVLEQIVTYTNTLSADDSPVLENFIQGKLWREKIKPKFPGKCVLPIILYYDDFQTTDLGTHSANNKLGGIYYTIPCLPPYLQSSTDNIFPAALFYVEDAKAVDRKDVNRRVLAELQYLEQKGIEVITEKGEAQQIFFALGLIIGDNPAVHIMLNLVESWRANYCCRFCSVEKSELNEMFEENEGLLRNRENYAEDVQKSDVSATGVNGECEWNVLTSYHCVENIYLDLMHEIDVGFGSRAMAGIIKILVKRKRFDCAILNDRIQSFDFTRCESGNRPPIIDKRHVDSGKLAFSASECLCFIRYFGLIIGDLIEIEGDDAEIFHLYETLREIIDILYAPTINTEIFPYLESLISKFLRLFRVCFPEWNITIKLHHMIHYIRILDNIGPLSRLTCYRFESKNKDFRAIARSSNNKKNMPLTMAKRHQMKFCYRLLLSEGLPPKIVSSQIKSIRVNEINDEARVRHILPSRLGVLPTCDWATVFGTTYHPKMSVVINMDDEFPIFGEIQYIVYDKEREDIFFLVKKYITLDFQTKFWAYEVELSETWQYIAHRELMTHSPSSVRSGPDGKKYMTLRHKL